MWTLKLIPQETNWNFMKLRHVAVALSVLLTVAAIAVIGVKGLNFGIDFKGGTLIEIRTNDAAPSLSEMREKLNGLGYGPMNIQEFGQPNDLLIRVQAQDEAENVQQQMLDDIRATLGEGVEYRRVEFVGPQVGQELIMTSLYAIIFSTLAIMAYIWIRFEWQYGLGAMLSLVHDSIMVIGLFALTGMEFNLSTVAAVLLVAGYSINDTVVVFDRIRENLRKYKKMPLPELLNKSVNETLSRTVLTSGTTLLALGALWMFGGEVIRGFTDALIWGILIGTYSSIFVAAPLLLFMNIRRDGKVAGADTKQKETA